MNNQQLSFFKRCYPFAEKAGKRFGMNPLIILAQAALESSWGLSYSARMRKNYFGILATNSTNEFWDGAFDYGKNELKLKFRVYKTEQDSFMDFARLIQKRYPTAYAAKDHKQYAQAIASSNYISTANGDNPSSYRAAIIQNFERLESIAKNSSGDPLKKRSPTS